MSHWKQTTIAGKTADLFEPAQKSEHGEAVLFLHGHGRITLRDNPVYTAELERRGWRCVCPHGQRSWWGDRICSEFDPQVTPQAYLRESLLPWLADHWGVAPPRIALLGVSMGGQGAIKLAYRAPEEFPIVAALAPAIDFHNWHGQGLPLDDLYTTAEEARQDTATLLLHPLNWPRHQLLMCDPADAEWLEGVERLASKLD
jgi:pimeloyl-ACP methyl ester carboxylesterase